MNRVLISFILFSLLASCHLPETPPVRLIDYVNPFIGTAGKGKTYPGATVPHGMIQLSPDNGRNGWDWISGYFYPDSVIAGFSHLHLSGTGAGDLYDLSFLPVSDSLRKGRLDSIASDSTVFSAFSHQNETASPGYYQVYLEDYDVNVELTATARSGLQRYSFERNNNRIRLHLGYSRNWDGVTASRMEIVNDTTITGYRHSSGWARNQKVFFVSVFSKPFQSFQLFDENVPQTGEEAEGLDLLAVFDYGNEQEVMIKTAISAVSIENARLNLQQEQTGFHFEKVKQAAQEHWEAQLQKVQVKASEDNLVQFYTAFYHSMLAPTLYSDVDGRYRGTDDQVFEAQGYERYSTFSLWDTYRALHPWMTIVHPERTEDFLKSLMAFYEESGQLPVWTMMAQETNMMIGYHAVPVLADALQKGFPLDTSKVLEAMKASAMQEEFGLKEYQQLGYVPYEYGDWNVSLTMEYAYDDWCLAQTANLLGQEVDEKYFLERAMNYRNHFDEESGFFRAKSAAGDFKPEFDPLAYHPADYCEANAWQYYWYAPQDVPGLIELTGGPQAFEQKLDQMFTEQQAAGESPEWISGYIGQYVHGNEPSHHVPYLFQYVNASAKTQKWVRQVMDELYTTQPDGLAGNEDCGQMSAWYLFSALGFYPVNPADGRYVLGSPEVQEATIHLPTGKTFKVVASNQSAENVYVESITLNGSPLTTFYITHQQILDGGTLIFEMADRPD